MASKVETCPWGAQCRAGDNACRNSVDFLAVGWRPDLCSEQTEAALHQTVIQVCQHDVVSTSSRFRVKRYWPLRAGVRVDQASEARLPGRVGESRHAASKPSV
jgi:hypothetical protein